MPARQAMPGTSENPLAAAGSEKKESKGPLKVPESPQNGSESPIASQEEPKWKFLDWREYQRPWEVTVHFWDSFALSKLFQKQESPILGLLCVESALAA